ncbi:GAF domain-containing sensor histidine kinase [Halobacillus litoralis]|uniref:GAF domain-containing sensor histidine kinase n=1 Tax=Halobacillus litoralis TaxID=45668 RepID=UPI001CFCD345|nr:GAF domain-containing sensor histidine kinase [Halobacillus litoralis]
MSAYDRVEELTILKVIAETLNRCNDEEQMLQDVLEKLLKLTKLESGWIFLVHEKPDFTLIAEYGLPPALSWGNKQPMCQGGCHCLNRYWNGNLNEPVNIIECKRLNDAIQYDWGDTEGITHHATVPLGDGEEFFGLINVASPHKETFSKEELTLLQSIAFQIGTAVKRTRLYWEEQKRAESYERLNTFVRHIGKTQDIETLAKTIVHKGGEVFQWSWADLYVKEGNALRLKASFNKEESAGSLSLDDDTDITKAFNQQKQLVSSDQKVIFTPVLSKGEPLGVMVMAAPENEAYHSVDLEMVDALSRNVSLVFESIRLQERRQEILLHEERKRLARDLHDSVNQTLFSLSLTARGAKEIIPKENQDLRELLDEMLQMSQNSMKEMRSLIWQLRPVGIDEGVVTAMKKYSEHLGLSVTFDMTEVPDWPKSIEETIWRISQEALNNVKKHTQSNEARIHLYETEEGVGMEVSDDGEGFDEQKNQKKKTLGLTSMKERAELVGGSFTMKSEKKKGTTICVFLPFEFKGE